MSKIMKTLNGYEVVDEKARQDIETLKSKEVDLSNYYNKAETAALVDKAIEGIDIPTVDLTPYATKQFVTDEIAKIDIPEGGDVDLSNYYTKAETDSAIKSSLSDYDVWVGTMLDGIEAAHCGSVKEYVDNKFANIATAEGGSY